MKSRSLLEIKPGLRLEGYGLDCITGGYTQLFEVIT